MSDAKPERVVEAMAEVISAILDRVDPKRSSAHPPSDREREAANG